MNSSLWYVLIERITDMIPSSIEHRAFSERKNYTVVVASGPALLRLGIRPVEPFSMVTESGPI